MQTRAADEGPSSGGSFAPRIGGQPSTENIVIEERYDPKLLRAVAKKYNIDSTKSLVKAYNATTDRDERAVLLGWLRKYDERNDVFLKPKAVFEYAELANIVSRPGHDDDIPTNLIHALCSCICQENFRRPNFAVALCRTLELADPSTYGGVAQLMVVAKKLLSSISPEPKLTRKNFAKYEATFVALQQTFFLLHKTNQNDIEEEEKQQLRRAIAEKVTEMKLSCNYYPVNFHFTALRQAVERLLPKNPSSHVSQAIWCGFCGFLYIFQCLRNLMKLDIDPAAIEVAYKRGRVAVDNMGVSKRPWFDAFHSLMAARIEASKEEMEFSLFGSECHTAMESQRKIKGDDLKTLRFSILQEMRQLANKTPSAIVRKEVTMKLLTLTNGQATFEEWFDDADIFTAFLDALHEIHTMSDDNRETTEALQKMQQSCEGCARSTFRAWLGGYAMEDKLKMRRQQEAHAERNKVFVEIGRDVGYVPLNRVWSNIKDLKEKYKHDSFAKVSSHCDKLSTELGSCLFRRRLLCSEQKADIT